MAEYNEAFRKIDDWCRENIQHEVIVQFMDGNVWKTLGLSNRILGLKASKDGAMLLNGYVNRVRGGTVYWTEGLRPTNDCVVEWDGEVSREMNGIWSAPIRPNLIRALVMCWHGCVKDRLLSAEARERGLESFEA